jgi:arylformamidase
MLDISRPISATLPVWPGDPSPHYQLTWTIAEGGAVNVGRVTMGTHTGTHVDAPWHYLDHAAKLHQVPLETWVGPCLVIDAVGATTLTPTLLDGHDLSQVSKVLFKTGQPDHWEHFPATWALVDPSLPPALAAHGISLFGTDAPSVDHLTSKDLPGHMAFAAAGVCIVESLALEQVKPGYYQLFCLPLPLHGADGAPARVILL